MQNSTLIGIIIAALVVLGGGWYFLNKPVSDSTVNTDTHEADQVNDTANSDTGLGVGVTVDAGTGGSSEEGAAPMNASVTYSASGFSPNTVTIKVGGTVTWHDDGTGRMWVASAQHPTHTAYSGTTLQQHCSDTTDVSFDECKNGSTYTFTFTKPGTWNYHNHSQASHFGTVIVEE